MHLDYKTVSFVFWAVAVISISTSSCGTRSTAGETSNSSSMRTTNNSPSQVSPAQNKPDPKRRVDFKNFTYPWYPSFLKSRSREVTLKDGKLEIDGDRQSGIGNLSLELDDVSYVNLRGEGKEDAIVTVGGITGVNRFVGAVFVYAIENETPKLLWQHETGDRAEGGLRRIAIENGILTLEEYVRSEGDGGLCCPKKFIRSNYKWDGNRFEKIKSEMFPSESKTAEFLGYPNSHP